MSLACKVIDHRVLVIGYSFECLLTLEYLSLNQVSLVFCVIKYGLQMDGSLNSSQGAEDLAYISQTSVYIVLYDKIWLLYI